MTEMSMTHVAMRVENGELKAAEAFYRRLLDLRVAFRETMTEDGWRTLPEDGWTYAERNGVDVGLVMLFRGGFAIDLEARPVPEGRGRFSHVGLHVDDAELGDIRARAHAMGCEVTYDQPHMVVFNDPYGMRWEVTNLSYDDPYALSAGRREGRWHTARAPEPVPAE